MRTPSPPTAREATVLEERVRDRALSYFPDLAPGPVSLTLVETTQRPASRQYRFAVASRTGHHEVMVKVPLQRVARGRHGIADTADRPRLSDTTDADTKHLLEHATLAVTAARFEQLADARFGAVRVLDHLPEERAIITERLQEPTLSAVLKQRGVLAVRARPGDLRAAFRNAGGWLRTYHGIRTETAVTRHHRRAEVLDLADRYLRFLARRHGRDRLLDRVRAYCSGVAADALPPTLPLGLAHGDFAPRNVFVSLDGRVTAFDMLGRWRAPVYEDLATFTTTLRTTRAQAATLGALTPLLRLGRYEDEFLRGYYDGTPPPVEPLRFYRLLILLDRWTWLVGEPGDRHGPSTLLRVAATTRLFRQELRACLIGAPA